MTFRAMAVVMTVLYTLVSLGSCSVTEQESIVSGQPDHGVPIEERVELHILQSNDDIGLELQRAVDLYLQDRGNVKITIETVGDPSTYRTTLHSRLLSGESADLFHISGASHMEELQEYLADLSGWSWIDSATAGTLEAVTIYDQVYGVPVSLSASGLVVNRSIFEVAGIPLAGINSFADWRDAFSELQEMIDSGELGDSFPELEAVTQFAGQDLLYLTSAADVLLAGSYTGPAQAARSVSLDLPNGGAAEGWFSVMARYSLHRNSWSSLASVTRGGMESAFASGQVAAIFTDVNRSTALYEMNPDLEGRLTLLPVYLEDEEAETRVEAVFAGASAYWAVNSGSPDGVKTEAEAFLKWLYQSEEGARVVNEWFGLLSPYQEIEQDIPNALYRQALGYIERGETLPQLQNEIPARWGEEVFAPQLREYLSRLDKTWEELLEECRSRWTALRES